MCTRRIQIELQRLKEAKLPFLGQIQINCDNFTELRVLLLPGEAPYNKYGFWIDVEFPDRYPFKPPIIQFLTTIYHPNVDEKGVPCLPMIAGDHWKPSINFLEIFHSLIALINTPQLDHAVRLDLAQLLLNRPKVYHKNAELMCRKYAIPRTQ